MPVSLSTVAEIVSLAVFLKEAAPVVAPLPRRRLLLQEWSAWERTPSRVPQECCVVDVGMVVPELSPVVSAREAAVPMSLPDIAEVVSSAVFAGGLLLM